MPVGPHCRIKMQTTQSSQLRFKVSELMAGKEKEDQKGGREIGKIKGPISNISGDGSTNVAI